jgi:TonB family protein
VERDLAECWFLFQKREGADAIMWLELSLEDHGRDPLVLVTLGQLYLMAGQGEPELLPKEGPAADVGDWPRNKARLLDRSEALLQQAGRLRPDDAAADYLLADVARARGDTTAARLLLRRGQKKCSLPRSLDILRRYQRLQERSARLLQSATPEYPAEAVRQGLDGEVVLDLLISPEGCVEQVAPVSSPAPELTAAAAAALFEARLAPARLGKYPIWSWLRMPTRFSLAE